MRKLVFLAFIFFSNSIFSQKKITSSGISLLPPNSLQTILTPCSFNGDFSFEFNACNPYSVKFIPSTTLFNSVEWDFGDLTPHSTLNSSAHIYAAYGNYIVKMILFGAACSDTITKNISVNLLNDNALITTIDTTICFGTTKLLRAQPSNSFCWSPTTYLNNPLLNNPTTSTLTNITYYYTAEVLGNNLIVNGDFSAGNTGFTSDYTFATTNSTANAVYGITTNAQAWNAGASPCVDHTSGTGNMLVANGATTAGKKLWKSTVNVTPNTNYQFSAWIQSISLANFAVFKFYINGVQFGPTLNGPSVACQWVQQKLNWNSGINTTVSISLEDFTYNADGNDFALDDISFTAVSIRRDSVKIIVDTPLVSATSNKIICSGSSAQLNAFGAVTYTWSPSTGLSNAAIANPIASPTATTNYTVTGTNLYGCVAQASVLVTVLPPSNFDFSYQQNACNPLSVQFFTAGANPVNPYWSFGDGNTLLGNNPTHVYSSLGNYTIKYHIDNAACPDTITKIISLQLLNADIVLTPDTTICFGSTKLLRAQASGNFCWSPTTYLNNSLLNNPTTSTPANITYYYTAETTGNNLIPNGDFSAGNTGFTSDYTFVTTNSIINAEYGVVANAQAWNAGASPCNDHTTGTGNMLVANGATVAGKKLWKSTVNVTPNTNYQFSAWIQSISLANFAVFKFYINGVQFGPTLNAPASACQWVQQKLNWNSGNNTTANISLEDFTYNADGNDFALDDISFAAVSIKRDSVKISIDTPVVNTIADVTVCAGAPVQLNANGASTYVWTPATGLSNPNIANPVALPQTSTRYTVNGTTINGCTASDFVDITVLPKPVITKTADTTICSNSSVQLNASGGTNYTWSPAATLNNANIANPLATPTAPVTKYFVTVTNNNVNTCSNTDSVKITLRPAPVFTVSPSRSTCFGTVVQLSAAGGDSYLWSPANLVSNATIGNPVTTPGTTTNYSVIITESSCNMSSTLFTTVTVNPVPNVNATSSNDIDCSIDFTNLSASGASQYNWSPPTGLSSTGIANPVAKPTVTTQYVVKGNNAFGCSDSAVVIVAVTKTGESGYFMPNSFTPNGDGLNDCFGIKFWGVVEQLDFSIYNRYGEKVFYSNNPAVCWNGKYKTEKPEPGNYVYYIKAKTFCGNVVRKGNVVLIR